MRRKPHTVPTSKNVCSSLVDSVQVGKHFRSTIPSRPWGGRWEGCMRNQEADGSLPAAPQACTTCGEEGQQHDLVTITEVDFCFVKKRVSPEEAIRCEDKFTQSNTDLCSP